MPSMQKGGMMARGLSLIQPGGIDRDVANLALDMARRGWIPRHHDTIKAVMEALQREVGLKLGLYNMAGKMQGGR